MRLSRPTKPRNPGERIARITSYMEERIEFLFSAHAWSVLSRDVLSKRSKSRLERVSKEYWFCEQSDIALCLQMRVKPEQALQIYLVFFFFSSFARVLAGVVNRPASANSAETIKASAPIPYRVGRQAKTPRFSIHFVRSYYTLRLKPAPCFRA